MLSVVVWNASLYVLYREPGAGGIARLFERAIRLDAVKDRRLLLVLGINSVNSRFKDVGDEPALAALCKVGRCGVISGFGD